MGSNLTKSVKGSAMSKFFSRFIKDEAGATAIEYGLIVALIAVVIIGAVTAIGGTLNDTFTTIDNELADA